MESTVGKKTEHKTDKKMWSRGRQSILAVGCFIMKILTNSHVHQSKSFIEHKKSGAMLVLCNHTSALDFCHFSTPFLREKVNFVVAENMMYSKPFFASMIKGAHCILKKQYFVDYQCIKSVKQYLDNGVSVILCPEGKVSGEGVTGVMPSSIAKLVKWLGYPVATVVTKGAGLTRPKWAKTMRRGRVDCHCDMLFSKDDTVQLSKDEIFCRIENALAHNEHLYHIQSNRKYRGGKYAEGLERLLYRCPKCGSEFAMTSKGDMIKCNHCQNAVKYQNDGKLVSVGDSVAFDRVDLWYNWQREELAKEVDRDDFRLQHPVWLFVENPEKNGYRFVSSGVITLDKNNLTYTTTEKQRQSHVKAVYKVGDVGLRVLRKSKTEDVEDEFLTISQSVKGYTTIATLPGRSLDLYDEKHAYRFVFNEDMASTKYALAIECMGKK